MKVGGTTGVGRLGKVNGVSTANASRDDLGMATDVEGTARGRPSDAGSATSTGSPAVGQLSAYGPRRNKYPKVWEVYPDELAEYVAKGGKVEEAAELGGASLKGGISSWSKAPSRISEDIKLATNSSSAQSPTHWNGSPILGASPLSVDRSHLFSGNSKGSSTLNRPDYSRQNSFEAAHLSRSGTTTTSVDFSGSSSLKRASSTTSAAGGLASAAGLVTAFTKVGDGSAVGNGYGSPRSRVASARGSRDFISSPTSNLDPSSPRILTSSQSPLLHSSPGQSTSASKPSPSTAVAGPPGVRSGISRRLDRIRGKTNSGAAEGGDTSDDRGAPPMSRRGSADYASPDPSDIEGHHRSPQSQPHRLRSPQRGSLAHLSDTGGSRRPNLRKNASSYDFSRGFDTDGYKSSGGEETSRRRPSRGIFSTAWQGFKGSLDVYGNDDPMPFGAKGTPAAAAAAAAKIAEMSPVGPVRRRIVLDESDEEEVKPQREVLDLGDEEFAQLNRCVPWDNLGFGCLADSRLALAAPFVNFGPSSLMSIPSFLASQAFSTFSSMRSPRTRHRPRRSLACRSTTLSLASQHPSSPNWRAPSRASTLIPPTTRPPTRLHPQNRRRLNRPLRRTQTTSCPTSARPLAVVAYLVSRATRCTLVMSRIK